MRQELFRLNIVVLINASLFPKKLGDAVFLDNSQNEWMVEKLYQINTFGFVVDQAFSDEIF